MYSINIIELVNNIFIGIGLAVLLIFVLFIAFTFDD